MPERLLLLSRFFLRLDGVVLRIRDTRVFVEFRTGEVIREYTAREEKYDTIKQKLAHLKDEVPALMRDPNKLSELMPVVERKLESLMLS
jgi:type 2A phosphatase activator TIP41